MSKKIRLLLLSAVLCTVSLVGCGNSGENTVTNGNDVAATEAGSSDIAADDDRYIDDGGIIWDTQEQMYVMEDDVLMVKQHLDYG